MKTILVIDDFASVRYYHESLLKQAGYHTVSAGNGAEALVALEQTHVDLIMLDLIMPQMTGREFLERLQTRPQYTSIPVLLITSDSEADLACSLPVGKTCGVLHKPILPQALIKEVAALLPPAGSTPPKLS